MNIRKCCLLSASTIGLFLGGVLTITGVITPPFQDDFEESDGHKAGPLDGKSSWKATGDAEVVDGKAFSGEQSLRLSPRSPVSEIRIDFNTFPGNEITFVDFFVLPSAGQGELEGTTIDLGTVQARFIEKENGLGLEFLTAEQDWRDSGLKMPVNAEGLAPDWMRITFRLSYLTGKWDLYIENTLALFDEAFAGESTGYLPFLSITGHPVAATLFDYVYVGPDHPLFVNDSRDGIADSFKRDHGLSTTENVRDYLFSDGQRAIDRFHADGRSSTDFFADRGTWIPFFEDFESRRPGSIHTQGGWIASRETDALVQQEKAFRGMRSLRLAPSLDGTVYHNFRSDDRELWISFQITPVLRTIVDPPDVPDFATAVFFFDRLGSLVVFDGLDAQWKSHPVRSRVLTGQWRRITLRQNYEQQEWAIWVGDILIADRIGFATSAERFSQLHLAQALQTETLVDDIVITAEEPDYLDDDGDGLANRLEYDMRTDPHNPDTSGDGMRDGLKVLWEQNPLTRFDVARLHQAGGEMRFTDRFDDVYFAPGPVNGQGGWKGTGGAAIAAATGVLKQHASVAATWAETPNSITRFVQTMDASSIWTTADMRFTLGPLPNIHEVTDPSAALIAADRFGFLHAFDGDARKWVRIDNGGHRSDEWRRVDIELNYQTKRWRVCLDGRLVDGDFGFRNSYLPTMSRIQVRGARGRSNFDTFVRGIRVSTVEPGDLDFSGDGMTNSEKRALGLDVYRADTDRDGIPDPWEIAMQLDPLNPLDGGQDFNNDGFSNLLSYHAELDPSSPNYAIAPWRADRIGADSEGGAFQVDEQSRLVFGHGWMLLTPEDQGFFTHQVVSGDFTLTARLRDFPKGPTDKMAGLMVRASLEPHSATSALLVLGDDHYWAGTRSESYGRPSISPRGRAQLPNGWMRIERRGNQFLQFTSEDGVLWRPISQASIAMPDTVFVGIGGCSRVPGEYLVANFDSLTLETVDESNGIEDDGEGAVTFNSIAWMGEWDGLGDYNSSRRSLRRADVRELDEAGLNTTLAVEMGAAEAASFAGDWRSDGSSLTSAGRRGWVEFDIQVDRPDVYLLEIEGREAHRFRKAASGFDLKLYCDGEYLGSRTLEASYDQAGNVYAFTPWLTEGTHRVRVLWDGAGGRTYFRLDNIRLRQIEGVDTSGNGIKDWVEERLTRQSGLDRVQILTYVSPLPLEGRDRFNSLMEVQNEALLTASDHQHRDVDRVSALHPRGGDGWDLRQTREPLSATRSANEVNPEAHLLPEMAAQWEDYLNPWASGGKARVNSGAGQRFWTDIPLAPLVDNAISVSWQNGVAEERFLARWVPFNLLAGGEMLLRAGDSLLLTAQQGDGAGRVVISIDGASFETTSVSPLVYTFSEPGDYVVTGTFDGADGVSHSGSLAVSVRRFDFGRRPLAYVGRYRTWQAGAGAVEAPVFEADPRLHLEQVSESEGGGLLRLGSDNNVVRTVVTRVEHDGPILASVNVESFRLFSSWETYLKVVDVLPDGSRLVEMMIILSPVPEDVKLRLEIFVGGIVFDDGTLERVLLAEDFDQLGQTTFRFMMPEEAMSSVCHRTYVYQDDELIGVR